MAEIVQTLFGISPESYQQQQSALADQRALQYAKLDPFQQANYAIGRGAYGLAGAIGGALGGQDPELQRITMRQQIAGQIDYNDDASMQQAITALSQAGDSQGAMQLQQIRIGQKAKLASIGKDEAAARASDATAKRERSPTGKVAEGLRVREIIRALQAPDLEDIERKALEEELRIYTLSTKEPEFLLKEARLQNLKANLRVLQNQPEPNKEAIQRIQDSIQAIEGVSKEASFGSSAEVVSKELYFKPFSELTQEEVVKVNAEVAKRKKDEIRAGVTPAQQQQKLVSQNKTDLASEVETAAYNSTNRVTLARNLKSLLPTAFTGVDANLKLQASRVAEVFGINIQGVPDSQIIDTILGDLTIGAASKLKGALSDKDVKFLKETIGTRGLSLRTLQFVADRIEQEALIDGELNEVVNKYVADGGDLNKFNFASQRKDVSEKVRKDIARLSELRNKAKTK